MDSCVSYLDKDFLQNSCLHVHRYSDQGKIMSKGFVWDIIEKFCYSSWSQTGKDPWMFEKKKKPTVVTSDGSLNLRGKIVFLFFLKTTDESWYACLYAIIDYSNLLTSSLITYPYESLRREFLLDLCSMWNTEMTTNSNEILRSISTRIRYVYIPLILHSLIKFSCPEDNLDTFFAN